MDIAAATGLLPVLTAEHVGILPADVARESAARHGQPPDPAGHEVVINATSLGMHRDDPLPVPAERLEPGTLVCDIVMSPPRTPLLLEASARGCIAHPGLRMLVGQVDLVLQFPRPNFLVASGCSRAASAAARSRTSALNPA